MLNLQIAMSWVVVHIMISIFSGLVLPGLNVLQTAEPGIEVTSPLPGSALQGSVVITGSTNLPGFQAAEVDFSYGDTGPANWFLIQQSQEAVQSGTLAVWDTSKIADGNYRLRVVVNLQDGKVLETTITGLRVRNYTVIETDTPTPVIPAQLSVTLASPVASLTPVVATSTPQLTPTLLPPNPAQVPGGGLWFNIAMGASFVTVLFLLLFVYLWFKGKSH